MKLTADQSHNHLSFNYLSAHVTSQNYQASDQDSQPVSLRKHKHYSQPSLPQSQTPNSRKSARATAALVRKLHTHQTPKPLRTEHSLSQDPSPCWRASALPRVEQLPRTLKVDPRKSQSAKPTMPKVDLVQALNALT